jgi:hypothetical protein
MHKILKKKILNVNSCCVELRFLISCMIALIYFIYKVFHKQKNNNDKNSTKNDLEKYGCETKCF